MFKPKLSFDSQELLVQQYKHLRQRDTGGSAKSSWRITVRQLESMLRLSEAFARLHCSDTVSKKHVQEAYRLLNKSIIRYIVLNIVTRTIFHFLSGWISLMLIWKMMTLLRRRTRMPWRQKSTTKPRPLRSP